MSATRLAEPHRIERVIEPFMDLTKDRERFDRPLLMSHLCAYRLAGQLAADHRMLEIGCGTGYGAYYLAHVARDVVAVDVEAAFVTKAQALFRLPNLRYLQMEGTRLTFPDGCFDVVGSFQVIEHIPEPGLLTFLREIARVLTPSGTLIVSTLNLEHNQKPGIPYQKASFHEKEFTAGELQQLLGQVFPHVRIYGLYPRSRYRVFQRLKKWGLGSNGPVRRFLQEGLRTNDHCLRPYCTRQAIDLIALCSKQPLAHQLIL
jgi:SAM-dependent methyltransferase